MAFERAAEVMYSKLYPGSQQIRRSRQASGRKIFTKVARSRESAMTCNLRRRVRARISVLAPPKQWMPVCLRSFWNPQSRGKTPETLEEYLTLSKEFL